MGLSQHTYGQILEMSLAMIEGKILSMQKQ